MAKEIQLNRGYIAIVSDEDYERVSKYAWTILQNKYAHRTPNKENPYGRMHRFILQAPPNVCVDHINGNGLDNRRENLRFCNQSQNLSNVGKRSNNKSGYKGVTFESQTSKWRASITVNYRTKHLGRFNSPEEAAHAYDKAALELHGKFARLNFPPKKD